MNPEYIFNIRVTGILIENNELLIVNQKLSDSRDWSLPGGRLERGETLEQGLKREFKHRPPRNISGKKAGWGNCSAYK